MKLITRNTDCAIRALCFIAKSKKKVVSVSELVKCLKISKPFLRKILQILNKERLLKSYRGQRGGFELALRASDIYVIDIMKVFQGPFKLNECILKRSVCPELRDCILKKKIDNLERYLNSELRSITIKDLLM